MRKRAAEPKEQGNENVDPTQPVGSRWSFGAAPIVGGNNFFSQDSGCAWINGRMYLYGGFGVVPPSTTAKLQRITWVYDPTTQTWADTGKLIVGTPGLWFGYTGSKSAAFFAGGTTHITTDDAPSPLVESFTPAGGWKRLTNLPIPAGSDVAGLLAPGMGILGTNLSVMGGGGLNSAASQFILRMHVVGGREQEPEHGEVVRRIHVCGGGDSDPL